MIRRVKETVPAVTVRLRILTWLAQSQRDEQPLSMLAQAAWPDAYFGSAQGSARAVSAIVKGMERDGLLQRGRRFYSITAKGRAAKEATHD
jgi:hypothetical protein